MKQLIIIRGVPGSGKSTLADFFIQGCYCSFFGYSSYAAGKYPIVCEADQFFTNPVTHEYKYERSKLQEAHDWCQRKVKGAMNDEVPVVIVSNCFIRQWEMEPYLSMAVECGYTVQEIICKGEFESVHGVPKEKIEKMKESFEYVPSARNFGI